jgi:hypothetical protein
MLAAKTPADQASACKRRVGTGGARAWTATIALAGMAGSYEVRTHQRLPKRRFL